MRQRFAGRVGFLTIYIKEAHPEDEWQMDANEEQGVCYRQPKTIDERIAIARDLVQRYDYDLPLLIDPMDNRAEAAYAGWPERLYGIVDGRIAYKGGVGPHGYDPGELEAFLEQRFGGVQQPGA